MSSVTLCYRQMPKSQCVRINFIYSAIYLFTNDWFFKSPYYTYTTVFLLGGKCQRACLYMCMFDSVFDICSTESIETWACLLKVCTHKPGLYLKKFHRLTFILKFHPPKPLPSPNEDNQFSPCWRGKMSVKLIWGPYFASRMCVRGHGTRTQWGRRWRSVIEKTKRERGEEGTQGEM